MERIKLFCRTSPKRSAIKKVAKVSMMSIYTSMAKKFAYQKIHDILLERSSESSFFVTFAQDFHILRGSLADHPIPLGALFALLKKMSCTKSRPKKTHARFSQEAHEAQTEVHGCLPSLESLLQRWKAPTHTVLQVVLQKKWTRSKSP